MFLELVIALVSQPQKQRQLQVSFMCVTHVDEVFLCMPCLTFSPRFS